MRILFVILFIVNCLSFFSQKIDVVFYNVENLFDTIDDPKKNDNEFLPENKKKWNSEKFFKKIDHINQTLDFINNPVIVGFCEIENKSVLELLLQHSEKRKDFGIVHYESEDERGIDVGLIYNKEIMCLVQSGFLRYVLPDKKKASSRDIVWAKFLAKKDTFIVLVNHWPSRIGGKEESKDKRITAANSAHHFVDSVLKSNQNIRVILMGDLNDSPDDEAPKLLMSNLIPQINKESGIFGGSYCYQNEWELIDHIMISNNLLGIKKPKLVEKGRILSPDFLMEEYKGHKIPHRTYAGTKYLAGYSDHLPVLISIKL